VRLGDLSFFVDHVGDAAGVFVFIGIARAVGQADRALGVAEQREGEVELFGEALVVGRLVEADAEDAGVFLAVLFDEVPEPGTFPRSAGCIGFRVKPEHYFLAAQILKADVIAFVIDDVEIRSLLTGLEHLSLPAEDRLDDSFDGHAGIVGPVTLEEWDQRYRTRDEIDDEPAKLVIDAVRQLPPGRALDLACGAGRNAVWLARNGWEVVAIDGSVEAIRLVHGHDVHVDARVLDLETDGPLPFEDESFDAVLILYYLYRPLFAEAKRVVRRGGIVVTAVRTKGRFAIHPGELASIFEGWEVVYANEGEIGELVARRPPSSALSSQWP
jgi:predicted O-methyltransferase YrrM